MGELPQETICAIASHLDKDDLRNFSLISRAFVAESQRQLFHTVVFYHHHKLLRWHRKITPAHPIIPSYVRSFVIFFSVGFYNRSAENEPYYYIVASEIFASFTKLEEIFLRGLTLFYPPQLAMVSNFSVSAPTMRSLRIEASQCSPGLMVKFIYLFPHLDDLQMDSVTATDDEPYDFPTSSPSFRGHGRLTLVGSYCSHLPLLPLRFKHLYLTFILFNRRGALIEKNIHILNDFFITCAPTLEHLALCEPEVALEMEKEINQTVDLSPCKRLRTLRLELKELFKRPPYVVQLLASLESNPRLETIALVFHSSGRSLIDGLRRFSEEWDPVDTQLCRLAELKDRSLRVSVGFNGFRTNQGMSLLDDFDAFMARFRCSPHSFTVLCDSNVVFTR